MRCASAPRTGSWAREGLITRKWVLGGGAGLLLLLAQSLLTYIISNAAVEIKATNEKLTKLTSTVEIEAVRNESLRERVRELEAAKAEDAKEKRLVEQRLQPLETRTRHSRPMDCLAQPLDR